MPISFRKKKQSGIKAGYVSRNTLHLSFDKNSILHEGQEVFVFRTTNHTLVNRHTGNAVGTKDKVLGRGVVIKVEGNQATVKVNTKSMVTPRVIGIHAVARANDIRYRKMKVAPVFVKPVDF